MKNIFGVISIVLALGFFVAPSVAFAGGCERVGGEAIQKVDAAVNPLIQQYDTAIAALPSGALRDALVAARNELAQVRDAKLSDINSQILDCVNDVKPLQDLVDTSVFLSTGGLSAILPERMTHIDVAEILNGNIFGGPNSIFNEVGDFFRF